MDEVTGRNGMGAVPGQSQRAGQDGGTKEGGGRRRLRVLLFDLVRERDRVREGSEMGQKRRRGAQEPAGCGTLIITGSR